MASTYNGRPTAGQVTGWREVPNIVPEPEGLRGKKNCNLGIADLFDARTHEEDDDAFITRVGIATSICKECPVRELCGTWFAQTKSSGIAGGVYHGKLPHHLGRRLRYNQVARHTTES